MRLLRAASFVLLVVTASSVFGSETLFDCLNHCRARKACRECCIRQDHELNDARVAACKERCVTAKPACDKRCDARKTRCMEFASRKCNAVADKAPCQQLEFGNCDFEERKCRSDCNRHATANCEGTCESDRLPIPGKCLTQ